MLVHRILAATAVVVSAALLPIAPAAASTRSFPDAVGDSGASSDIRWVKVTNSLAQNRFAVKVGLDQVDYDVALVVYVDLRRRNPGPELRMSANADSEWAMFAVNRWGQRGTQTASCGRVSYSKSTARPVATWHASRGCLGVGARVRVAAKLVEHGVGVDWAPARRTFFPAVRATA